MCAHVPSKDANVPEAEVEIGERRQAAWLKSDYADNVWTVTDTRDQNRTARINFNLLLADGRMLEETDRLYSTVKEYAWWIRDPRFSGIDDARTHAVMVRNLLNLSHALSLRGIWTFSHLQPYDVEQLVEECRFGADAVLRASDRVQAYVSQLAEANSVRPQKYGGLPEYICPSTGRRSHVVHVEKILEACNLPASARVLPRVSAVIARAAAANGLRARSEKRDRKIEPLKNVTVQALQRWLDPLEQLHAMRRWIEADAVSFKPFPLGAARVAAVKGVGTSRTPTPPPKLALHLLEHSARWIFDHRPKVVSITAERSDIMQMATACWIIIAAFTARRDEEINDLRSDCPRGDDEGGWWLHVYIEKTLQRKEWIPVPKLVIQAVEVLLSISAGARRKTGTNYLFQWLRPDGKIIRLNVGSHLGKFADAVRVPLHRPRGRQPVAWHWHPHQFRRFFAILYFYRFEGATLEALSHHLRHFSLEMTRRYVTQDPEAASLWTDVEWGYTGHYARTIVAGERSVSGARGEKLKKAAQRIIDQFRRKLRVATVDRVGASLALVIQKRGLVLTPKPWVTCSCPNTRMAAAQASCRRKNTSASDAVGPDFAHAGPSVCVSCPHAIVEGARTASIEDEIDHLEAAASTVSRDGTMFGALERARVVELRQTWQTRYETASPVLRAASDNDGEG